MSLPIRHRLRWLFRRTPSDLPYLLLLVQTAVALAISPLPARSLGAVWPHALGLASYYVIARLPWTARRLARARVGLGGLTLAMAAAGLLGIDGVRLPSATPEVLLALRGHVGAAFNPNVVAGYLALLTPISLGLLVSPHHGGRPIWVALVRTLFAGAVLAGAVVLVMSDSRGGLAAGAIGALAVLAIRWPRIVLPLTVVAGGVAIARSPGLSLPVLGEALAGGAGSVSGMEGRVEIWQRAVYILQDFSFTGLGFGCFEPVVEVMYPLFLTASGTQPHAHNLLLQVGVDLGLPGLIAFGSWAGITLYMLARAALPWRSWRESPVGSMAMALCAGFLSVGLHGLLDAAVWGNKGAFIPWAIAALAVPLFEAQRRGGVGDGGDA